MENRPVVRTLRLAGVVSLAVSAPIFSFILENRSSLHLSGWGAFRVAIVFWLVPISLLALTAALFPRREKRILTVVTALGIAALLAQAAARAGLSDASASVVGILLFVGFLAIGTVAAVRFDSILPPIFEAVGGVSVLLAAGFVAFHVVQSPKNAAPRPPGGTPHGPVVVIVFDGLSDFALDSSFPSFHRLTDEGHRVREAWTHSDETLRSIPMLLSGRWETGIAGLDRSDRSLLARAAERYDLEVYGVALGYTDAFGARAVRCLDDRDLFDAEPEILLELLARAFAWRVFPRPLQRPLEEDDFRRFMKRSSRIHAEVFLASLASAPLGHRFYFVHLFHPHPPFSTTPDGRVLRRDEPDAYYRAVRPEDLAAVRRLHREEIAYCDALLGRVRETLERRGVWDDALLVVTADHGLSSEWATRGYGSESASDTMTDEIARVPMIWKLPRRWAGVRLADRMQHLDFAPMLLDAMGFPPSATPPFEAPRVVTKFGTVWTRDTATGAWRRPGS